MEPKKGKYKHYKGNEYELLFVARHSETLEDMVIYKALYGDRDIWARPKTMFMENVVIDGKEVPRFEFLNE